MKKGAGLAARPRHARPGRDQKVAVAVNTKRRPITS